MRIGIIVGHFVRGKDKGSVNYKGEPESLYNYRVAKKVRESLKRSSVDCDIYLRDDMHFPEMAQNMVRLKTDMSIELHFNSFSQSALGCECLALNKDLTSITFADLITDKIALHMGVSERHAEKNIDGVLRIAKGGRGYNNLNIIRKALNPKCPVVLVEPCFANFKNIESAKFFENEDSYVESIVSAILTWNVDKDKQYEYTLAETNAFPKSPANSVDRILTFFNTNY